MYIKKNIIILFILFGTESNAQKVSNVSILSTNQFNFYAESDNYAYLGVTGNKLIKLNEEVIVDYGEVSNKVGIQNDIFLLKLSKGTEYISYVRISPKSLPHPALGNVARFVSKGLYIKENKIYLYGSMGLTDSLYIADKFHKLVNTDENFVLVFNEDLELIDEFYFGNTGKNYGEINGISVYGDEIRLCGIYGVYDIKAETTNYLYISGDSIPSLMHYLDYLPIYYAVVDLKTKKLKRGFSFGGIGNKVYKMSEDDEENNYIACDGVGEFEIEGEMIQYQGFGYDFLVLKIDKEGKVGYKMLCEGWLTQSFLDLETAGDFTYEALNSNNTKNEFYMNSDTIVQTRRSEGVITKRTKNGNLIWVSQLSCENNVAIYSVNANNDRWLAAGGAMLNPGCFDGGKFIQSDNDGFSPQGFFSLIDQKTGEFKSINVFDADSNKLNTTIAEVVWIDSLNLRVFMQIGGYGYNNEKFVLKIGNSTISNIGILTLLIIDFDLSDIYAKTIDLNEGVSVLPNPIMRGEQLTIIGIDNIKDAKLIDLTGKLRTRLDNDFLIPNDIEPGFYFLWMESASRSYVQKIIIH